MFNSRTRYRIEVLGEVDVAWLQSFGDPAQVDLDESQAPSGCTLLSVHGDQSAVIGLLRRLHGLGVTILRFRVVPDAGQPPGSQPGADPAGS